MEQRNGNKNLWRAAFAMLIVGWALVRWALPMDVDEGLTLTSSWQVSQGLRPYVDFFEFYPPGSFYLLGFAFKIFGSSYVVARLLTMVLALATAWGLDRLCSLFTKKPLHRFTVLALWFSCQVFYPFVNHNHYALLASIWATYALILAWRENRAGWYAAAGAAAGATAWFLQTRGAALVLAGIIVVISTRRWKNAAGYLLGLLAALAPMLLVAPFPVLWQHLVVFPFLQYAEPNFVSPNLLFATFALLFAVAVLAWRTRLSASGFWPLWLVAALQLFTIWSRADIRYLALVLWPLPILFVAITAHRWEWPTVPPWPRIAKVFFYYASFLLVAQLIGWSAIPVSAAFVITPHGNVRDRFLLRDPFWSAVADEVVRRTGPGEPIFATPYIPATYFFTQRPNATRYNVLLSRLHPQDFFAETVASLERVKPKIVVRVLGSFAVGRGFHRDGTVVDHYLDTHYHVVMPTVNGYTIQILERNSEIP